MRVNYKPRFNASCRKCKKKSGVCLRRGFEGHLPIGDVGLRPADRQLGVAKKIATTGKDKPNIISSTMRTQPVGRNNSTNKRKFINLQKNIYNSNTTISTKHDDPPKQKAKVNEGPKMKRNLISGKATGNGNFIWSDNKDRRPVTFLKNEGYVYLKKQVPKRLCHKLKKLIELDMETKRQVSQSDKSIVYHQEEPMERMSIETAKYMNLMKNYIVKNILRTTFDNRARVPNEWNETVYGRMKLKNDYTSPHRDYTNTIIERNLLSTVNDLSYPSNSINWKMKGKQVRIKNNRSRSTRNMENNHAILTDDMILSNILNNSISKPVDDYVPIYTVWVPLHSLESLNASHLRIHPNSHTIHDLEIKRHKKHNTVIGIDSKFYRSNSKMNKRVFLSPATPYDVGDIVIFHCLTRHEANSHANNNNQQGVRISFDMRALMDGMSNDEHPLVFCV
eukprot:g8952.t1